MALLHLQSCQSIKSELSLFELPSTQTAIDDSRWVEYKPISSLSDQSPIEFTIPGTTEYIDLAHTLLSVRVSIVPVEKEPENPNVGPVNNFMHSLFNQVDVFFNQKPVSPPNNAYAYRSYIETLLNYGPAAKKSHLTSVLWYTDTAGKMDNILGGNDGYTRRKQIMTDRKIDLLGHLHCDVFNQDKLLMGGVEVRVRLVRSRDSFCLMDVANAFTINITDATLFVRRVNLNPSLLLSHEKMLAETTAKYPLTRVEVKSITLQKGASGQTVDNIIIGQLPKRIIIGFVENTAYLGDKLYNPFNFRHFNLNFLCLYIGGKQIPSKPLQPDFKTGNMYVDAYHTLFTGTGIHFLNLGNSITREDYPNGYCLFAFDLTPDLSANDGTHWNLIKNGTVRMDVRFDDPLNNTVNCVIYAEYDNLLEIDSSRQVLVDYSG